MLESTEWLVRIFSRCTEIVDVAEDLKVECIVTAYKGR